MDVKLHFRFNNNMVQKEKKNTHKNTRTSVGINFPVFIFKVNKMEVPVPDQHPAVVADRQPPLQVVEVKMEGVGMKERPREIYEVSPGDKVSVTGSMCGLSTRQAVEADIRVSVQVHAPVVCKAVVECFYIYYIYRLSAKRCA